MQSDRARIILLAFGKRDNAHIASEVGCERHSVGIWRRRWADAWKGLIEAEMGRRGELRHAIEDVLRDAPRPGPKGKFTADQVVAIIALACEPPDRSGRPVTHWTAREIADEAVKRGIVPSISTRQVGRFLKDGRTPAA